MCISARVVLYQGWESERHHHDWLRHKENSDGISPRPARGLPSLSHSLDGGSTLWTDYDQPQLLPHRSHFQTVPISVSQELNDSKLSYLNACKAT